MRVQIDEFFRGAKFLLLYTAGGGSSRTLSLPDDGVLPDMPAQAVRDRHRDLMARGVAISREAQVAVSAAFTGFITELRRRTPSPLESFKPSWSGADIHPSCSDCLGLDQAVDALFEIRLGALVAEAERVDMELTELEERGRQAVALAVRKGRASAQRNGSFFSYFAAALLGEVR
ncbi:MAG: hypothetical protein ABIT01_06715 [Thermoanaerobaculia bacterium]